MHRLQKVNKIHIDLIVIKWYNKINKEKTKNKNIFVRKKQIR